MLHSLPLLIALATTGASPEARAPFLLERISTKPSFPRGLQLVDDELYVLCRGRVRDYGGVSAAVDDQAGTLFVVDLNVAEEYRGGDPGDAVRENGRVLAEPTSPPFRLWDRTANPPWSDRESDRPYCGLTWHPGTQSFYICAFAGVDRDEKTGKTFSKNLTDAILRYDRRTSKWYDVERHDIDKGGIYPHHDPETQKPPHGWLNGPDNCLAVGSWLYGVSKDNSRLVLYDLRDLEKNPEAGAPSSAVVLEEYVETKNAGRIRLQGHSALGLHDGWLYLGTRTSGHVVRLKLGADLRPAEPRHVELIAQFDAYDPKTKKSGNVSDMSFGPDGDLYAISMQPARVFRIRPDPKKLFDARAGKLVPYIDLAGRTNNPKMKSENLLVDGRGRVYVTSGDAYGYQAGSGGVVWRVTPTEG
jgi:hypothetical protein